VFEFSNFENDDAEVCWLAFDASDAKKQVQLQLRK